MSDFWMWLIFWIVTGVWAIALLVMAIQNEISNKKHRKVCAEITRMTGVKCEPAPPVYPWNAWKE